MRGDSRAALGAAEKLPRPDRSRLPARATATVRCTFTMGAAESTPAAAQAQVPAAELIKVQASPVEDLGAAAAPAATGPSALVLCGPSGARRWIQSARFPRPSQQCLPTAPPFAARTSHMGAQCGNMHGVASQGRDQAPVPTAKAHRPSWPARRARRTRRPALPPAACPPPRWPPARRSLCMLMQRAGPHTWAVALAWPPAVPAPQLVSGPATPHEQRPGAPGPTSLTHWAGTLPLVCRRRQEYPDSAAHQGQ